MKVKIGDTTFTVDHDVEFGDILVINTAVMVTSVGEDGIASARLVGDAVLGINYRRVLKALTGQLEKEVEEIDKVLADDQA